MMNSQTILFYAVNCVVSKFTELGVFRANVRVKTWANSMFLHIVPIAVSISASNSIVGDNIVRVGNPVASRGLICREQTIGSMGTDCEIVVVDILCLSSILNKVGVAHCVERNVVEHSEVVNTVSGYSSVVGLPD